MMKWPIWLHWIVLIIGILFLIKDIMNWGNYWWDLNWWTAMFIILGLGGLFKTK